MTVTDWPGAGIFAPRFPNEPRMIRLASPVLFLAAGLLAACEQSASGPLATDAPAAAPTGAARIAYVNADTILANYAYLSGQTRILSQRQQDASTELERRLVKFQEQVHSFQRRAQAGSLTPKQIEAEQRVLAEREQELAAEQQRLAGEFQGEGLRLQNVVATVLKREVAAVQEAEGYDYVLQYGNGSPVLAVNDAYDITDAVLARMNESGAEAAAVDTTE